MGGGGGGYIQQSPSTAAEVALAQQMWGDYKQRFLPIEKKLAKQSTDINYGRTIADSAAASTAMQGASQGTNAIRRRAYGLGINPGSGRAIMIDASTPTAAAVGKSIASRNQGLTNERVGTMKDLAMIGQHKQTSAAVGYQKAADIGTSEAIARGEYQNAIDQQTMGAAGAALGTFAGAMGNFGLGRQKINTGALDTSGLVSSPDYLPIDYAHSVPGGL